MAFLNTFIRIIDTLVAWVGKVAAYLVLGILGVILAEIATRAVIGRSLSFAEDMASWLLVAVVFLGGPYALQQAKFVRVDAAYEHYSPRWKALVDTVLSSALLGVFLYAMIKLGSEFAYKSFVQGEVSATGAWNGPVWVAKALMPAGCTLLLLAWISHILKMWRDIGAPSGEPV